MNKIFGYGYEDIPYINRLKARVFYGIVIIIVLLNLFISLTLNFKKITDNSLFNSFIIVDLQHNLNEKEKNEIENFILSLKGVSSVRFMDKSESFRKLQDELNISIPESTNPLSDSIIVYLKDIILVEAIQENLEAREEIKEVFKDEDFFNVEEKKGLVFSFIELISGGVAILLALVAIVLFNLNVGIRFLNHTNMERNYNDTIRACKLRNLLSFSGSTLIGTLIFFNIYVYFRKYIFIPNFDYAMLSLWQIIIWHMGAIIFLNFIVWVLPATISKIGGDKE